MLKSMLRRIAGVLGLSLLLGSVPAEARAPQVARPALWQISDADTTIYLFGTIHLLPNALKWRTPAFDDAVGRSQELVVETIVDQQHPQAIAAVESSLGFRQGLPPIVQRVPAADVPKLRAAIAKSGVPEKIFDQMKTWLAAISLLSVQFQQMGLKGTDGPEEVLRQQFLSTHKPIDQLETNLQQFSYFDGMSEAGQRDLLEGALDSADTSGEFDQMLAAWARGDVKGIARSFNHDLSGSPELERILLEQRNAKWSKWIEQRLTQPGSILVAVGAGHLAGPHSVIGLLKRDGYRVRRLQ